VGAFDNVVFKLPKDVELSPDIRERAEAYFEIMNYGRYYYVPITKEVKKLFGLKRKGKEIIFKSFNQNRRIYKFLHDVISGIYLQIRDTVGSEIHQEISQQITGEIEKRLDRPLWKEIERRFDKKLTFDSKEDLMEKHIKDLTWTCHVCGKERPDDCISVFVRDVSKKYDLTPGTMTENIRYCNDNQECLEKAKMITLLKGKR